MDGQKGLTDRQEEEEKKSSVITCQPSRDHVHLRGVGLQDAVQLLLGSRVGSEVDRPDTPDNTAGVEGKN